MTNRRANAAQLPTRQYPPLTRASALYRASSHGCVVENGVDVSKPTDNESFKTSAQARNNKDIKNDIDSQQ
jgi:hypothetical protein